MPLNAQQKNKKMKKVPLNYLLIAWLAVSFLGAYLKLTHSLYYLSELILGISIVLTIILIWKLFIKLMSSKS